MVSFHFNICRRRYLGHHYCWIVVSLAPLDAVFLIGGEDLFVDPALNDIFYLKILLLSALSLLLLL